MLLSTTFLTGLLGSLILVTGAAWPDKKEKHPARSAKNWFFAVGGFVMLAYSVMLYFEGGSVFFLFLESLVVLASVFMMLNVPDHIDGPVIAISGSALIAWSLYLFEGYETIFFVIGLSGVGFGYAMQDGTLRRNVSLTFGSALIALFSYFESQWIFFYLNIFFAIFSAYYAWKSFQGKQEQ